MDHAPLKDAFVRNPFLISFLILAVGFGIAYLHFEDADHLIILHFTGSGIDITGNVFDVFALLFSGAVILGVNFLLACVLYHRRRFLAQILAAAGIFIAVLILIAVGVIISVN